LAAIPSIGGNNAIGQHQSHNHFADCFLHDVLP
jgi:hypothetical protein